MAQAALLPLRRLLQKSSKQAIYLYYSCMMHVNQAYEILIGSQGSDAVLIVS